MSINFNSSLNLTLEEKKISELFFQTYLNHSKLIKSVKFIFNALNENREEKGDFRVEALPKAFEELKKKVKGLEESKSTVSFEKYKQIETNIQIIVEIVFSEKNFNQDGQILNSLLDLIAIRDEMQSKRSLDFDSSNTYVERGVTNLISGFFPRDLTIVSLWKERTVNFFSNKPPLIKSRIKEKKTPIFFNFEPVHIEDLKKDPLKLISILYALQLRLKDTPFPGFASFVLFDFPSIEEIQNWLRSFPLKADKLLEAMHLCYSNFLLFFSYSLLQSDIPHSHYVYTCLKWKCLMLEFFLSYYELSQSKKGKFIFRYFKEEVCWPNIINYRYSDNYHLDINPQLQFVISDLAKSLNRFYSDDDEENFISLSKNFTKDNPHPQWTFWQKYLENKSPEDINDIQKYMEALSKNTLDNWVKPIFMLREMFLLLYLFHEISLKERLCSPDRLLHYMLLEMKDHCLVFRLNVEHSLEPNVVEDDKFNYNVNVVKNRLLKKDDKRDLLDRDFVLLNRDFVNRINKHYYQVKTSLIEEVFCFDPFVKEKLSFYKEKRSCFLRTLTPSQKSDLWVKPFLEEYLLIDGNRGCFNQISLIHCEPFLTNWSCLEMLERYPEWLEDPYKQNQIILTLFKTVIDKEGNFHYPLVIQLQEKSFKEKLKRVFLCLENYYSSFNYLVRVEEKDSLVDFKENDENDPLKRGEYSNHSVWMFLSTLACLIAYIQKKSNQEIDFNLIKPFFNYLDFYSPFKKEGEHFLLEENYILFYLLQTFRLILEDSKDSTKISELLYCWIKWNKYKYTVYSSFDELLINLVPSFLKDIVTFEFRTNIPKILKKEGVKDLDLKSLFIEKNLKWEVVKGNYCIKAQGLIKEFFVDLLEGEELEGSMQIKELQFLNYNRPIYLKLFGLEVDENKHFMISASKNFSIQQVVGGSTYYFRCKGANNQERFFREENNRLEFYYEGNYLSFIEVYPEHSHSIFFSRSFNLESLNNNLASVIPASLALRYFWFLDLKKQKVFGFHKKTWKIESIIDYQPPKEMLLCNEKFKQDVLDFYESVKCINVQSINGNFIVNISQKMIEKYAIRPFLRVETEGFIELEIHFQKEKCFLFLPRYQLRFQREKGKWNHEKYHHYSVEKDLSLIPDYLGVIEHYLLLKKRGSTEILMLLPAVQFNFSDKKSIHDKITSPKELFYNTARSSLYQSVDQTLSFVEFFIDEKRQDQIKASYSSKIYLSLLFFAKKDFNRTKQILQEIFYSTLGHVDAEEVEKVKELMQWIKYRWIEVNNQKIIKDDFECYHSLASLNCWLFFLLVGEKVLKTGEKKEELDWVLKIYQNYYDLEKTLNLVGKSHPSKLTITEEVQLFYSLVFDLLDRKKDEGTLQKYLTRINNLCKENSAIAFPEYELQPFNELSTSIDQLLNTFIISDIGEEKGELADLLQQQVNGFKGVVKPEFFEEIETGKIGLLEKKKSQAKIIKNLDLIFKLENKIEESENEADKLENEILFEFKLGEDLKTRLKREFNQLPKIDMELALKGFLNGSIEKKLVQPLFQWLVYKTEIQRLQKAVDSLKQYREHQTSQTFKNAILALLQKRNYKLNQWPIILYFEYKNAIFLRRKQVNVFETMDKQKKEDYLVQMMMGEGKTSVIIPLLLYMKKAENKLLTFVAPKAQLDATSVTLSQILQKTFGYILFSFDIKNMNDLDTSFCKKIYYLLFDLKKLGYPIALAPETLSVIYLFYLNCCYWNYDSQERFYLNKVLKLFKECGVGFIDEVDLVLTTEKEVNVPFGSESFISKESLNIICLIYQILIEPRFEYLALLTQKETVFQKSKFKESIEYIAEKLFDSCLNPEYKDFLIPFQKELKAFDFKRDFICFVRGQMPSLAFIHFLNWLQHSSESNVEKKEYSFQIFLVRHLFQELLCTTLERGLGRHFGRLENDKVVPYIGVDTPSKNQFGYYLEAICYHFQTCLQSGVLKDTLNKFASNLHKKIEACLKDADLQKRDWLQRYQEDPEILEFKTTTGFFPYELEPNYDPKHRDLAFSNLEKARKQGQVELLLKIESESIFSHVKYFNWRFCSDPQTFCNFFSSLIGFSGTPWNLRTYPQSLQKGWICEKGVEGQVILEASLKGTPVHSIKGNQIRTILAPVFKQYSDHPKRVQMLLDPCGMLKNKTTKEVAFEIFEFFKEKKLDFKAILFFNRPLKTVQTSFFDPSFSESKNERQEDLSQSPNELVFLDQAGKLYYLKGPRELINYGLYPGDYFIFLDELKTTGVDLKVSDLAVAVMTFNSSLTISRMCQSIMRLRGFFDFQSLHLVVQSELEIKKFEDVIPIALQAQDDQQKKIIYRSLDQKIKNVFQNQADLALLCLNEELEDVKRNYFLKYLFNFLSRFNDFNLYEDLIQKEKQKTERNYHLNQLLNELKLSYENFVAIFKALQSTFKIDMGQKFDLGKACQDLYLEILEYENHPLLERIDDKEIGRQQVMLEEANVAVQIQNLIEQDVNLQVEKDHLINKVGLSPIHPPKRWKKKHCKIALEWLRKGAFPKVKDQLEKGKKAHFQYIGELAIFEFDQLLDENLLCSHNFYQPFESILPPFHERQRLIQHLLLIQKEDLNWCLCLITQQEAAVWKDYTKVKQPNMTWLIAPSGDCIGDHFTEEKMTDFLRLPSQVLNSPQVQSLLVQVNVLNGNASFLLKNKEKTLFWIFSHPVDPKERLDLIKYVIDIENRPSQLHAFSKLKQAFNQGLAPLFSHPLMWTKDELAAINENFSFGRGNFFKACLFIIEFVNFKDLKAHVPWNHFHLFDPLISELKKEIIEYYTDKNNADLDLVCKDFLSEKINIIEKNMSEIEEDIKKEANKLDKESLESLNNLYQKRKEKLTRYKSNREEEKKEGESLRSSLWKIYYELMSETKSEIEKMIFPALANIYKKKIGFKACEDANLQLFGCEYSHLNEPYLTLVKIKNNQYRIEVSP